MHELVLYGIRELALQHYEPLILLQSEINNQAKLRLRTGDRPRAGGFRSARHPETSRQSGRVPVPAGTQAASAQALRGGEQAVW